MNGPECSRSILVVDDDPRVAKFLALLLAGEGHNVTVAGSGPSALEHLETRTYDLILSDYAMPGMSGLELFTEATRRGLTCPFVIVTGSAGVAELAGARNLGIRAVLAKPIEAEDFVSRIAELLASQ